MDQSMVSEQDHLRSLHKTETAGILNKVKSKAKELKMGGLTHGDRDLLQKNRLDFVWGELVGSAVSQGSGTKARKAKARRAYEKIQTANDHLFLAVLLVVPPTHCGKRSFDEVLEHLLRLEGFEPYNLGLGAKNFFESTAAQQGFAGSRRYLSFMRALFPESERFLNFICDTQLTSK